MQHEVESTQWGYEWSIAQYQAGQQRAHCCHRCWLANPTVGNYQVQTAGEPTCTVQGGRKFSSQGAWAGRLSWCCRCCMQPCVDIAADWPRAVVRWWLPVARPQWRRGLSHRIRYVHAHRCSCPSSGAARAAAAAALAAARAACRTIPRVKTSCQPLSPKSRASGQVRAHAQLPQQGRRSHQHRHARRTTTAPAAAK